MKEPTDDDFQDEKLYVTEHRLPTDEDTYEYKCSQRRLLNTANGANGQLRDLNPYEMTV